MSAEPRFTEAEEKLLNSIAFDYHDVLQSVCRESFYAFVQKFWHIVVPEKPVWNWHIEFLCNELQIVMERVIRGEPKEYDLVINLPPGSSKTTIISIMLPMWVWTRLPSARFICASYTFLAAVDMGRKSRMLLRSELFQKTFTGIEPEVDNDAKGYFSNKKGGMRFSVGVHGASTSKHAHAIIIDDSLNPQKANSPAERLSARTWMKETIPSRSVRRDLTPVILVEQRLDIDDCSDLMLSWDDTRRISLPAEITETIKPDPPCLEEKYVDGLMDPVRLPRKVLEGIISKSGQYAYDCQYLQSPQSRKGGMFETDKLTLVKQVPGDHEFKMICRFWDKAFTQDGGCYTCGVKMGKKIDRYQNPTGGFDLERISFWVLDVERFQLNSHLRDQRILKVAKRDGKHVRIGIEQEPSAGKQSAEASVAMLAGFKAFILRVSRSKEDRADTYSAQVNGGSVFVKDTTWTKAYVEELKYFPGSTIKDQVDASTGAFWRLSNKITEIGAIRKRGAA